MYFEKNIWNLIYSFDNTYKNKFEECLIEIKNLKPTIIYYGTPSMYKIKNNEPFFGKCKKFNN